MGLGLLSLLLAASPAVSGEDFTFWPSETYDCLLTQRILQRYRISAKVTTPHGLPVLVFRMPSNPRRADGRGDGRQRMGMLVDRELFLRYGVDRSHHHYAPVPFRFEVPGYGRSVSLFCDGFGAQSTQALAIEKAVSDHRDIPSKAGVVSFHYNLRPWIDASGRDTVGLEGELMLRIAGQDRTIRFFYPG